MDIENKQDDSFFIMSDGSPTENLLIARINQMLILLGLRGEGDYPVDDGLGYLSGDGKKTYKNYAHIPYIGGVI